MSIQKEKKDSSGTRTEAMKKMADRDTRAAQKAVVYQTNQNASIWVKYKCRPQRAGLLLARRRFMGRPKRKKNGFYEDFF